MGKKGKEYEPRKAITDEQGVLIPSGSNTKLYSSISEIFVADLLCEGEIEGIVSGDYIFQGQINETGYTSAEYIPYAVQGKEDSEDTSLGFLKSVYWNEVPVVDSEGYYNFPEINLKEVKGSPTGLAPTLNSELSDNSEEQLQDDMQVSLFRNIGDRLFGPPIEVGEKAPKYYKTNQAYIAKGNASFWYSNYDSQYGQALIEDENKTRVFVGIVGAGTQDERSIIGEEINLNQNTQPNNKTYSTEGGEPTLKGEKIDRNAKTYTISNKECVKVAVNIRVPNLTEQIKDDTTDNISNDSKSFSSQRKGTSQSGNQQPYGQGDLRARKIRYQVYFRPVFDTRHSKSSFFQEDFSSLNTDDILIEQLREVGLIKLEDRTIEEKLIKILDSNGFSDYIENTNQLVNLDNKIELSKFLSLLLIESKDSFPWKLAYEDEIFGRFDQPYLRSRTVNLENYGIDIWNGNAVKDYELFQGWEIKIVRLTPDSVHTYLRNQSFVDSLVEIYKPKMRYPYCAMVYSKFGADNFSAAPARSYDSKLIKVKIPNNYDPIKKTYGISAAFIKNGDSYVLSADAEKDGIPEGSTLCYNLNKKTYHKKFSGNINADLGDHKPGYVSTTDNAGKGTDPNQFWNGEFKTEKYWTDNPAWCFYDLITNFRYGLGEYINTESMDKWTLYDISKYCDVLVYDNKGSIEPRFTFNHLIISRDEAYKILNDLASAFRSMLYYAFGQIYVVQDNPKEPVYHFNNANVIDGKFKYSSSARKARHTVALVRYIDKHSMYKPALSYTEDPEGIRRYGIREIQTSAIGCTSEAQAKRFGDWMLKSENLETESISFSAGIESSYLRPGDVFSVYDRYRNKSKLSGRTLEIRHDCQLDINEDQKNKLSKDSTEEKNDIITFSPFEDSPSEEILQSEFIFPVPFKYSAEIYESKLLNDIDFVDRSWANPVFNKVVIKKIINPEKLEQEKKLILSEGLTKKDNGAKVKINQVKKDGNLEDFEDWLNDFYTKLENEDASFSNQTTFYIPYEIKKGKETLVRGRKQMMEEIKKAVEANEKGSILDLGLDSSPFSNCYLEGDERLNPDENLKYILNINPYTQVFDREDNGTFEENIVEPFTLENYAANKRYYHIGEQSFSTFEHNFKKIAANGEIAYNEDCEPDKCEDNIFTKIYRDVKKDDEITFNYDVKKVYLSNSKTQPFNNNNTYANDPSSENLLEIDQNLISLTPDKKTITILELGDYEGEHKEATLIVILEKQNVTSYINHFNDSDISPILETEDYFFEGIDDAGSFIRQVARHSGEISSQEEYTKVEVVSDLEGKGSDSSSIEEGIRNSFVLLETNISKNQNTDTVKKEIAKALNENLEDYITFTKSSESSLFYYKDSSGEFDFSIEEDDYSKILIKLYGAFTKTVDLGYSAELQFVNGSNVITTRYGKDYIEGDCITLDRPIKLNENTKYNFSILTPSFNYENNEERRITDLDSRDSKNIRKPLVQKLDFLGFQAVQETGSYYSDYQNNGKGIVTKIYFNGDEETSVLNTGDFEIKPYNNYVWSIEPDFEGCEIDYSDKNSNELMSGHLDYYRVINIKEEENEYEINALQYSYSKYTDSDCSENNINLNSNYCSRGVKIEPVT